MNSRQVDVVVVGGGSAGIAAAIAAARQGAETLLIEAGPDLGGELLSGLPVDGCLNARGEWVVGGIARELFERCADAGCCIGPVFDWRLNYGVCIDPEMLRIVIAETLSRSKVLLLLYSMAIDVVRENGHLRDVIVQNRSGRTRISATHFVDCSGAADLAHMAGAPTETGDGRGNFQPVSLVFRMGNIDFQRYLEFVRDHPDEYLLAESPVIDIDKSACARKVYEQGWPFTALSAAGHRMARALEDGRLFPTTAIYMWPTSRERKEMGFNVTRIPNINATDTEALSGVLAGLTAQVTQSVAFLKAEIPGFADAWLSHIAPRIGVRETRRILGQYVLTEHDVLEGRKFPDAIARGSHHIDIHGAGTAQERIPVKHGNSYDIPYRCLIPRGVDNLFVAGRCLSSTRAANGSTRVMGQCLATGEAAGTAAGMCAKSRADSTELPVEALRRQLKQQHAVIDGTH